jgi:hypothetical protein
MPLVFHEYPELRLRITTPEGMAYERASPLKRAEGGYLPCFQAASAAFPALGHRFSGGAAGPAGVAYTMPEGMA